MDKTEDPEIRLQKFIAASGLCSRRRAEELMRQGRVMVDGRLADQPGIKVIPGKNRVMVDGKEIEMAHSPFTYIALHKPRQVLSTAKDPFGRKTVLDLVPHGGKRIFPVGRLDLDSEGLILLTDDGQLTHLLLHPSTKVPKTYMVTVKGRPSRAKIKLLRKGIEIQGKRTMPCSIKQLGRTRRTSVFKVILHQGMKRQIRLMFKEIDHEVTRLVRTAIGPLKLEGLGQGEWRMLLPEEVAGLKKAAGRREKG